MYCFTFFLLGLLYTPIVKYSSLFAQECFARILIIIIKFYFCVDIMGLQLRLCKNYVDFRRLGTSVKKLRRSYSLKGNALHYYVVQQATWVGQWGCTFQ